MALNLSTTRSKFRWTLLFSTLLVLFSSPAVSSDFPSGCTDAIACNYNPAATEDDGSCDYCSCVEPSYSLTIEEYAADIVDGYTTYRFYLNMVNDDDFLQSVFGNYEEPMSLSFSEGFYNNQFGSAVASGINPAFLAFFPELAADSWITIGIDSQNEGDEASISTVEDPNQPFVNHFSFGTPQDGQNVVINSATGGSWYVLNGTPNGLPDELGRVLVMQVSTTAEFWGNMNFQVLEHGNGSSDLRPKIEFDGTGTFYPAGANPGPSCGCTDSAACNFNSGADYDDGSCEFADPGDDCSGNCNNEITLTINLDGYDSETGWILSNASTGAIIDQALPGTYTGQGGTTVSITQCLADGCYNWQMTDSYGDGQSNNWNGDGSYFIADADGNILGSGSGNWGYEADNAFCLSEGAIVGCTDATALNWFSMAEEDDGSCEYIDPSCTNSGTFCYSNGAMMEITGYAAAPAGDSLLFHIISGNIEHFYDQLYVYSSFDFSAEPLLVVGEGAPYGWIDLAGSNVLSPTGVVVIAINSDMSVSCSSSSSGQDIVWEANCPIGCTDEAASNYNPFATLDDGTCEYIGCTDANACNYDPDATVDNGACILSGECGCDFTDSDLDGLLDCIDPCTDLNACNYDHGDPNETECDYSCVCQDETACNYGEPVGVGTLGILVECWEFNFEAYNYPMWYVAGEDSEGNIDSWVGHAPDMFFNEGFGLDACWTIQSMDIPSFFEGELWITLMDTENGTPYFQDTILLNQNLPFDIEICASDYVNDGCTYPLDNLDCSGECINDADGDSVCDEFEIPGCQEPFACNYFADATDDDGSCVFAEPGLDCEGNCLSGDNDGDGICNDDEPPTCGIAGACNYDPFFVQNDAASCTFPGAWENCEGECLLDVDGDGVCDNVNDYVCGVGRLLEEYEGSFELDWCTENPPSVDFRVVGKEGVYGVNQSTGTSILEWNQNEFTEEVTAIVAGSNEYGGQNLLMGIDRSGHPIPLLYCPETGGFEDPNGWVEFLPTPTEEIFTEVINVGPAFVGINDAEELVGWGFTEPEFATNYPPVVQSAKTIFYRPYWWSAIAVLESNETVPWGGAFQMPFITIPSFIAQSGLQIEQIAMTEQNGLAVMEDGTLRAWGTYNAGFTVIPSGLDSIIRLDFAANESFAALLQTSGEVQAVGFDLVRVPEGLLQNIIDVQATIDGNTGMPKIVALRADGRIISVVLQEIDDEWILHSSSEAIIPGFEPILCIPGCTDAQANNYNDQATEDDESCQFGCPDSDGDGVCDSEEVVGCTSASACNFNPLATQENGTCYFADEFEDCDGDCIWESVATGGCGELAGLACDGYTFGISPASGGCSSHKTGYFVDQGAVGTAFWQSEYDVAAIEEAASVFVEPNDGQLAWINADGLTGGLGSCNELVVPQVSNALKVDMEGNHGVILRNNGTVASFAPSSAYDALEQTPIIFNYFVIDACAGADFNLAVDGSQNILYWGIPNFALQNDYMEVPHAGGFVQVTAYGHAAAAITEYGELVVWGDEPDIVDNAPNAVSDAVSVALGEGFGIVLHENGDVTQWGTNAAMPAPPTGLGNIIELTASKDQVLAQASDGTFVSWGVNTIPDDPTPFTPLSNISVDIEFCIPGCTSPDYHNYDPSATIDDGSCNNIGCTVAEALNFEPWATDDDGSCIILGCTDPQACNYNPDAQYGIRLDAVAVHDGIVGITDLSGFTTYHVVITGPNPTDRLSAVMGDNNTPLSWQVTDGVIWHEMLAGDIVPSINTNFIGFIPELAFDSWVTIGVDPYSYNASEPVMIVESIEQPWIDAFDAGNGIEMSDGYGGAWFVAGAQTTGLFGEDQEALLAQITTNGVLHLESMNIQILPAALVSDDVQLFYEYELHACSYADGVLDCEGACVNDSDQDGICDENEVPGCTDTAACNFNADATDDDGTCEVYNEAIEVFVETIAVHEGTGDLSGHSTYRLYALMHNAEERVSAVVGFEEHPLLIQQGNGFMYQHPFGDVTPNPLTPAALSIDPDAAYDSYVALGRGHEDLPTSVQILSGTEDWDTFFEIGLPIDISSLAGGGWYSTDTNDGQPTGEDHRVLLGQFTTIDGIQGQVSIQYFDCNGNEVVVHDLIFTSENNLAGCMDPAACNYDTEATIDDGSCCYSSCAIISGFATVELEDLIDSNEVVLTQTTELDGEMSFEFCITPSCYLVSGTEPAGVTASWDGVDVSDDLNAYGVLGDPDSPCVGCTDEAACNYQPTTIFDNETCALLPGDFNGDLATTVEDMLMLLSQFNNCEFPDECATDINGSGFVSVEDLLLFLSYFGTSCDD